MAKTLQVAFEETNPGQSDLTTELRMEKAMAGDRGLAFVVVGLITMSAFWGTGARRPAREPRPIVTASSTNLGQAAYRQPNTAAITLVDRRAYEYFTQQLDAIYASHAFGPQRIDAAPPIEDPIEDVASQPSFSPE